MNLNQCNTIDDCVLYGEKLDLSHSDFFIKTPIEIDSSTLIISNYTSILSHYMDYINKSLIDHTFSDEDMMLYNFKPKLFCLDNYGTVELWSLLLRVNNMSSIIDFKKKNIKVFNITTIFNILNEIMILEKGQIDSNNDVIDKKIISMTY